MKFKSGEVYSVDSLSISDWNEIKDLSPNKEIDAAGLKAFCKQYGIIITVIHNGTIRVFGSEFLTSPLILDSPFEYFDFFNKSGFHRFSMPDPGYPIKLNVLKLNQYTKRIKYVYKLHHTKWNLSSILIIIEYACAYACFILIINI